MSDLTLLLGDPAAAIAAGFERDPTTALLGALLAAWRGMFGDKAVAVREAVHTAERGRSALNETDPTTALLDEIVGQRGGLNPRRLGHLLAACERRRVDGLRFERGGTRQRAVTWRAVRE